MCNLYSITTSQEAIRALFRVMNCYVGNLPPMQASSRTGFSAVDSMGLALSAKRSQIRPASPIRCARSRPAQLPVVRSGSTRRLFRSKNNRPQCGSTRAVRAVQCRVYLAHRLLAHRAINRRCACEW
jgi:hypothetical protein